MIEVVEKRDKKFVTICPECESKLRYTQYDEDVRFNVDEYKDVYSHSLICPNCGCEFEFEV